MSELIKKANFKVTALMAVAAVAVFFGGWLLATGSLFAQEGGGDDGAGTIAIVGYNPQTSPVCGSTADVFVETTGDDIYDNITFNVFGGSATNDGGYYGTLNWDANVPLAPGSNKIIAYSGELFNMASAPFYITSNGGTGPYWSWAGQGSYTSGHACGVLVAITVICLSNNEACIMYETPPNPTFVSGRICDYLRVFQDKSAPASGGTDASGTLSWNDTLTDNCPNSGYFVPCTLDIQKSWKIADYLTQTLLTTGADEFTAFSSGPTPPPEPQTGNSLYVEDCAANMTGTPFASFSY